MKKISMKAIAILLSMVAVVAVIGLSIFLIIKNTNKTVEEPVSSQNEPLKDTSEEDLKQEYVLECKYTGGIGYPEVYEYPFKRTENYVSNKELWAKHPERIEACLKAAKDFAEEVFNVNYKEVEENRVAYEEELTALLDPEFVYNEDNTTGEVKLAADYAEVLADKIIENEYIVEAEFISDTSLVYEDVYNTVRGVLKYTVYSSKNDDIPADGITKEKIIHIRVNPSNEVVNVYHAAYYLAQDEMIFDIE